MSANVLAYRPLAGPVIAITHRIAMRDSHTIPQLGFGTYRLPVSEATDAVAFALSCGYRHVDCAKAYGNEAAVGEALAQALRTRCTRREDLFVTSKLWPTDQHPDHVEAACRATLAALQLDYLDLYLIHWPVCMRHTPHWTSDEDRYPRHRDGTPAIDTSVTLLDTWTAMNRLVDRGLVKSIGLANCTTAHVNDLVKAVAEAKLAHLPVLNQVEHHPGIVDGDLIGCLGSHDMLMAAYCPLGMPTCSTPPGFQSLLDDPVLRSLSAFSGFSPARLLLNWSVDRHNVVIVKSASREHIRSNAKAARFALDDRTRLVLDNYHLLVRNFRVMNPTHFSVDGATPFFAAEDARLQREIDAYRSTRTGTTTAPPSPRS
ncbi:aldo-keto reductase-like protein [Leishmania major strain Friedlin]|uniref:Aldo-keto reductase-like protein n=1 Tax=Leishmania major TaxID=5664 RepID=E9ACW1_LEIMA|nr:aldo-keto reductase-like protein [Leishmania major strain Friedlin]CAG9576857.1 aldo-keto_reductase-like_protein [Leishmania major strain Friedlin]CBZ12314.1 aldo-keto reductase-like protein [Leishmania major strain Friedlin]|eukprot:XP_003722053.1 aldo-keto reductase-like protein [Leishmania major strain Friedlin]